MTKTIAERPISKANIQQHLAATHDCACFNIRKTARAVTQHFATYMNQTDLKETQFSTLAILAQTGPLPIGKLANILIMDRTSLTRTARPLQTKGYVKIMPGQDSRTREIHLTDLGRDALRQALPFWEKAQENLVQDYGVTNWRDLKRKLERLTASAHDPHSH